MVELAVVVVVAVVELAVVELAVVVETDRVVAELAVWEVLQVLVLWVC